MQNIFVLTNVECVEKNEICVTECQTRRAGAPNSSPLGVNDHSFFCTLSLLIFRRCAYSTKQNNDRTSVQSKLQHRIFHH